MKRTRMKGKESARKLASGLHPDCPDEEETEVVSRKRLRAVIFDIDGTLLDSVDLHARAWQEAFRHFDRVIPFGQVRSQIGKGGDQLMPVFFTSEELERFGRDLAAYRRRLFKQKYLPQVRPFPQVRELFERLLSDGRRIALASSASGDELEAYKQIAGIADLIEEETSSDDVERSKPHPDVFAAALEKLGDIGADEAVAVGDTPYDTEAAGKIGLRTIGLLCGGFPAADLRAAGCIELYSDPADLLARYEQSPLAVRSAREQRA